MGKIYRLEDDLLKKSRPKYNSGRYNRLKLACKDPFAKCEIFGAFLLNPQSIIIHQGGFCQSKNKKFMRLLDSYIVRVDGKFQQLFLCIDGKYFITSNGAFGQRDTYIIPIIEDEALKLISK